MVVNFEFLGEEAIENLITCMNFKIDKLVYFGYQDTIDVQRDITENFLKKYCDVKNVMFVALPHNNMQEIIKIMRSEIQKEIDNKNQIYFDITGGESLILVAFGMLSMDYETPMHMYDIENDKLIELDANAKTNISQNVEKRKVAMTLDLLVKMHGGKINTNLKKDIKGINDQDFMDDIELIYQTAKKNWSYWNPFSDFLRSTMVPVNSSDFSVRKKTSTIIKALSASKSSLKSIKQLNKIVDELALKGILLDVKHSEENYSFRFKNKEIKECLWEGGSILELHTCLKESKINNECQVGVHLDWDGIIHGIPGQDVLNEIDVLSLNGNIPTFISCKSGKMGSQQALHALYELETVTRRFGGKYAKKVLVTAKGLGNVYMERAKEMGIEVR